MQSRNMKTALILFSLLGVALCGTNPHGGMLIPDIVERLWITADLDDDGHLDQTEFKREFIDTFDHDHSLSVSEHEFTAQWNHNYHDPHTVALHVFQHFDLDGNNFMTSSDLERLFSHMDYDRDNLLSRAEFFTLMGYIYGRLPY